MQNGLAAEEVIESFKARLPYRWLHLAARQSTENSDELP